MQDDCVPGGASQEGHKSLIQGRVATQHHLFPQAQCTTSISKIPTNGASRRAIQWDRLALNNVSNDQQGFPTAKQTPLLNTQGRLFNPHICRITVYQEG